MAPRPPLALAVGTALVLALSGCGQTPAPEADVTPTGYIAAVQGLLDPPAQMASSISERARGTDAPAPTRERLREMVATARSRLASFRALRLPDPALRRQRDRLAGAYARLIPRMASVADALAPARGSGLAIADGLASVGARADLRAAAGPFLDALRQLPSAASSPSR